MKNLIKEKEDLTTKLEAVDPNPHDFSCLENSLKESLEDGIYSKKKMEEELPNHKDELVDTYNLYFEGPKEHVAYLYLEMNLIQMNLFKMGCDE